MTDTPPKDAPTDPARRSLLAGAAGLGLATGAASKAAAQGSAQGSGEAPDAVTVINRFDLLNYVDPSQHASILAADTRAQDETLVLRGFRACMDAMIDWVSEGVQTKHPREAYVDGRGGSYAINDEAFSDHFDNVFYGLPRNVYGRIHYADMRVIAKNWIGGVGRIRTTGHAAALGLSEPVPVAMWRQERKSKGGVRVTKHNVWLQGEEKITDPIGLLVRNMNKGSSTECGTERFMNHGEVYSDVNNSDFHNLVVSRCGWQPTLSGTARGLIDPNVRFAMAKGKRKVTCVGRKSGAYAGQFRFRPDHVGQWFLVSGAYRGSNAAGQKTTKNEVLSARIVKIGADGLSCTLDTPASSNAKRANGSFTAMTCNTRAGSNQVTLNADLDVDMTGRLVMIHKAGSDLYGDMDALVGRVVAASGRILTLSVKARFTVQDTLLMPGVGFYLGKDGDQRDPRSGTRIKGNNNDIQLSNCRMENSYSDHRGSAVIMFLQNCAEVTLNASKAHGISDGFNNIGSNPASVYLDNCKLVWLSKFLLSWGSWHPELAKMVITGGRSQIDLDYLSTGNLREMRNGAFFLVDPMTPGNADCRIGGTVRLTAARKWPSEDQFVFRYGPNGSDENVWITGPWIARQTADLPDSPPLRHRALELVDRGKRMKAEVLPRRTRWTSHGQEIGLQEEQGFYVRQEGRDFPMLERGTFTPQLLVGGVAAHQAGAAYHADTQLRFSVTAGIAFVMVRLRLTNAPIGLLGPLSISLPEDITAGGRHRGLSIGKLTGATKLTGTPFVRLSDPNTQAFSLMQFGSSGEIPMTGANLTSNFHIGFSGRYDLRGALSTKE